MFRSSSTKVLVQFTIHRLVNICVGTRTICTSTIHNTQTSQYTYVQVQEQYVLVQFTIHKQVNICLSTRTICTSSIHNLQTSQYVSVQVQYVLVQYTIHRLVNICVSTSTICTSTIHNTQTSQYICQYKNNVYDVSPLKSHLPSPHSKDCVPFSVSRFGFPLGYSFATKGLTKQSLIF